jgi:hypothetical protein
LFEEIKLSLVCLPKPSLEAFIQTCTPLAVIPELEADFKARVEGIANALLMHQGTGNPVENLAAFLKADKDFLGIVLALTNLSQEKFLRILSAERFTRSDFGSEWGIETVHRKLQNEAEFAEQIAKLFLDGRNSPLLTQQVAAFYLEQLSLPADWDKIITDKNLIQNIIRRKLMGEYYDKKGEAIENIIRYKLRLIQQIYGIPHSKGQVMLVGKEVDHVLPSIAEPFIFIMTSYMETTSSSQTTRANEQRTMFLELQNNNLRYGTKRVLVNFVDGAGWLARRSDLRKLYDACDYIINLNTLDRLEAIICKHIPEKYFTSGTRPQVEG